MSILVFILAGESDRGLALAGAAMLDDALEVLLKARLLDKPKAVTSIIGLDRPLGTFSSRIKVTYLLGLLEETEFRDLELIRKIRNDCAHNRGDVDFGAAPQKDRIAELHAQKKVAELLKTYFSESWTDEGRSPRNQLLAAICFLCAWLIHRADMVKRSTIPDFSDVKRRAFEVAKNRGGAD
jgi:DNA-binding MltR family transcriptional regulator